MKKIFIMLLLKFPPVKPCFLFLSLLLAITDLNAQQEFSTSTFISSRYKPYKFSFLQEAKKKKVTSAIFKDVEVMDYTADTSRIGFFKDPGTGLRQIIPAPQTSLAIASYLNDNYTHASGSYALLVVIKKFWLSDIPDEKETGEPLTVKPDASRITFRAEAYLKDVSGYIPFGFLDTTITSPRRLMAIAPFRIPELFEAFMEKMHAIDPEKVLKSRRRLSFTALDSFSSKQFSFPIQSTAVLKKGVYANIQEFRNNNPTIHNYEVSKDESGMLALFLQDEHGKPYFSRKMWGYCDGQNHFVMMDGNLFPILRDNNAWYVYGSKQYQVKRTNAPLLLLFPTALVVGSIPLSEKVVRRLQLFTLDLESGEIY